MLIIPLCCLQDDSFVLDICLKAVMTRFQSTKTLLDFASKVIGELDSKSATTITAATVADVHRSLSRLGTFHLLCQLRVIEKTSVGTTGLEWQVFRQADLVEVMKSLVRKGHLAAVELVWTREFSEEEFVEALPEILAELPESLDADAYSPWLKRCVLPQLKRAENRSRFEYWLEQRARVLELQERSPHTALALINLLDPQL